MTFHCVCWLRPNINHCSIALGQPDRMFDWICLLVCCQGLYILRYIWCIYPKPNRTICLEDLRSSSESYSFDKQTEKWTYRLRSGFAVLCSWAHRFWYIASHFARNSRWRRTRAGDLCDGAGRVNNNDAVISPLLCKSKIKYVNSRYFNQSRMLYHPKRTPASKWKKQHQKKCNTTAHRKHCVHASFLHYHRSDVIHTRLVCAKTKRSLQSVRLNVSKMFACVQDDSIFGGLVPNLRWI